MRPLMPSFQTFLSIVQPLLRFLETQHSPMSDVPPTRVLYKKGLRHICPQRSPAAHQGLPEKLHVASWHLVSSNWNELHAHVGNVWLPIFLNTFHNIDFKSSTIVFLRILWLSRSFRGPRTHIVQINCLFLTCWFPMKNRKNSSMWGRKCLDVMWTKTCHFSGLWKVPYLCVLRGQFSPLT